MSQEVKKSREKTPEQALARLMALTARAEKSSGDALRLMRVWGIAADEQRKVLKKLVDERFIDDVRYCAAFVREKTRLNGWGVYKIRSGMAAKGIAREIIDEALSSIDTGSSRERLEKLLRARASKLSGTPYEIRGKLVRYGAGLGYDFDTVIEMSERIVQTDE